MKPIEHVSDQRKLLNRTLYIACRKYLIRIAGGEPDEDAIREHRAECCFDATEEKRGQGKGVRDYKALSLAELKLAVQYAEGRKKVHRMASEEARAKMNYHAMYCAIYYADLSGISLKSQQVGLVVEGDALRATVFSLFQRRGQLPPNVFQLLRTRWVNRKCNELLYQANMRPETRTPEQFYDAELTAAECNELIKRFKKIQSNLPPISASAISSN